VYADDVNLLGDSVNIAKENTKTLLEASSDVGLKIKAEKIKYIISDHQNSGQNHNMITANEIRMAFMMKSRADWIQGMLAINQSRIFCLPVSYRKKN
jgi:hypothetical protein